LVDLQQHVGAVVVGALTRQIGLQPLTFASCGDERGLPDPAGSGSDRLPPPDEHSHRSMSTAPVDLVAAQAAAWQDRRRPACVALRRLAG